MLLPNTDIIAENNTELELLVHTPTSDQSIVPTFDEATATLHKPDPPSVEFKLHLCQIPHQVTIASTVKNRPVEFPPRRPRPTEIRYVL